MKYVMIWTPNRLINLLIALLSFVIILDPPNSILHLKDPIFILLLISCIIFKKPTSLYFTPFILCAFIWAFSSVIGYSTCKITDVSFNFGMLKALSPLILLGWIKKLNFTKALTLPCILISIISIILIIAMTYYPILEHVLYKYFTLDHGLMLISRREFVGINLPSAFYKSAPLIVFPLSAALEQYLFYKKKSFFVIIVLFLGLISAGNRACILSAVGIVVCCYFVKLYQEKRTKLLFAYLFIGLFSTAILLFILLNDRTETSNAIKFGHLYSYLELFNDNPLAIILGQGAGSLFYTIGFGGNAVQTEWTYIELIRYFGIFGSLIIICIYIYPILIVYKRSYNYPQNGLIMIIGYGFYLLAAGTNPLLISSTGIIACLYNYSYIYYGQKREA